MSIRVSCHCGHVTRARAELHWLMLADADGTVLDTLELRRDKQVQAMLRMLTSVVDIDVERS